MCVSIDLGGGVVLCEREHAMTTTAPWYGMHVRKADDVDRMMRRGGKAASGGEGGDAHPAAGRPRAGPTLGRAGGR